MMVVSVFYTSARLRNPIDKFLSYGRSWSLTNIVLRPFLRVCEAPTDATNFQLVDFMSHRDIWLVASFYKETFSFHRNVWCVLTHGDYESNKPFNQKMVCSFVRTQTKV